MNLPIPVLRQAAAGLGEVRFIPDADGVARRVAPCTAVGPEILPSFGLAPLFAGSGHRAVLEPGHLRLGQRTWPLDEHGDLVLRFPGRWRDYSPTSLIDLITSNVALSEGRPPAVDPNRFRDKVVVIGSTAQGLLDLRKTPLEAQTPGFYISAAAYAAGATGRVYDERWRTLVFWPLAVLLALLGACWGAQPFARGALAAGLTLAAWWAAALGLFFGAALRSDVVTPSAALLVAYGLSLALSYRREQQQKRFIQGAFSRDPLAFHPDRVDARSQAAHRRRGDRGADRLLLDLAGFTSVSERLGPQALVSVLNLYLGEMVDTIVEDQQGYVDKFIGDAVMAFWGAPLPDPEHALRACLAALRNQERLQALQGELRARGLEAPLGMRIGIHTGPAVVGMMGSPKKLNYTIIGDTVNLASRLEGVNKQFGTRILISEETWQRVQGRVVARELDRIRVKGKTQPTRIYELVGLPGRVAADRAQCLQAFAQGSAKYFARDFSGAVAHFTAALAACPDDQPAQILLARCRQYVQQPPPPDWDGVTTLTSK